MLSDQQLLKYSRQIMLPEIDIEGQQKLNQSKVLILGLGGLGSPVAMYLATAGLAELILVDDDHVELSNLQRQIIHNVKSVNIAKVESAKETILSLNPEVKVTTVNQRLTETALEKIIAEVDLVIDCSDNFETRFMLNRLCFSQKKTLVSGAAIRWEGQLSTYTYEQGTPCYRCLYEEDSHTDETCAHNGVVAPLVGIIGSIQAMEAIKALINVGQTLTGRLLIFDGLAMEWRSIRFKQREGCPVCK